MTTSPPSIPVRILRRNWFLPGFGLLVAAVGLLLFQLDFGHTPVGGSGILGMLAIWLGSVFASATAWRNS